MELDGANMKGLGCPPSSDTGGALPLSVPSTFFDERLTVADPKSFHVVASFSTPKILDIIKFVCAEYNVAQVSLVGARRSRDLVYARWVAFWLCRDLTHASYPMIGRMFGGRDHTTILYGCRKIEEAIRRNRGLGQRAIAAKAKMVQQ